MNSSSTGATMLVVLSSAPENEAERLAGGLVEAKLAACVKLLGPVVSCYRWDGAIQRERETVMLIKTRAGNWNALEKWLSENHPYDVPELIALEAHDTAAAYLQWVIQETT